MDVLPAAVLALPDAGLFHERGDGRALGIQPLRQPRVRDHGRVRAEDRELESVVLSRLVASGLEQGIDVDVKAGVGRLSGRVSSWADRYSVLTVARNTDGVRAIRDDLIVTKAP